MVRKVGLSLFIFWQVWLIRKHGITIIKEKIVLNQIINTWLLYSLWIGKNKRAKSSVTKIIFFSLDFKCKNTCDGNMSFPVNIPITHWPVNSAFWVSAVQLTNLNVYHFISVSGTISCTRWFSYFKKKIVSVKNPCSGLKYLMNK